jgi:hypothetical protein
VRDEFGEVRRSAVDLSARQADWFALQTLNTNRVRLVDAMSAGSTETAYCHDAADPADVSY